MKINSVSNQFFGASVSERFQKKIKRRHGDYANYVVQELKHNGNKNTLVSDLYTSEPHKIIAGIKFPNFLPENTYIVDLSLGQSIPKAIEAAERQFIHDFITESIPKLTLQNSIFRLLDNFPEKRDYLNNNYGIDINYELRNEEEMRAIRDMRNRN